MKRKTIKNPFETSGIGLHKGKQSRLIFRPGREGSGLRFVSDDFEKPIEAILENLHSTARGTNLSNGKNTVYTVEHALSALSAFEIDDADMEIHGEEPPALDGSAEIYAELIEKAGIVETGGHKRVIETKMPLTFKNRESFYELSPAENLEIECVFENPHPLIKTQSLSIKITPETYKKEIAPARTFGFEREIEYLRKNALALGGSLENAVVLTETGILNKEPLRFPDEFVRHKILDLIGDLALLGLNFKKTRIKAFRPSHEGNIGLARLIKERSSNER